MQKEISNNELITVSIVVPVRNESEFIVETLTQLYAQDYPRHLFQVLVVDGESEDNTKQIAADFANKHPEVSTLVLDNPGRLSSRARNIGVMASNGHYVLVIDGHVHIPSKTLLSDMVKAVHKYDARVIGRPQRLEPPNISAFQYMVAKVRASRIGHSSESHIYSNYEGFVSPLSIAVMYDRKLFEEVGYFNEQFDAAEDLEFNFRLEKSGYRCFTSPKFEVFYFPRTSLPSFFRQMFRYGSGRANFYFKNPDRLTLNSVVPAIFVIGITLLGTGAVFSQATLMTLLAIMGTYLVVVLVSCAKIVRSRPRYWYLVFPIAAAIHIGLGLGMLKGTFSRIFHRRVDFE